MKLNQFKDALMKVIYHHLRDISQEEIFNLLFSLPDNPPALLKLTETQWDLIKAPDPAELASIEIRTIKPIYESLIKSVIIANQGYELWKEMQSQISSLPGWWHFFSPLRSLTLALNEVMNSTSLDTIKKEDDSFIRKTIQELINKIKQFAKDIKRLTKECNQLKDTLRNTGSYENKYYELKELYAAAEREKNYYYEQLQLVQAEYESNLQKLHDTHSKNTFMQEEMTKVMETVRLLVEENKELHQTNGAKLEEGDSAEIMKRHNQTFRGRTPSRTSRFYQPARPAANEDGDKVSRLEAPGI